MQTGNDEMRNVKTGEVIYKWRSKNQLVELHNYTTRRQENTNVTSGWFFVYKNVLNIIEYEYWKRGKGK